VSSGRKSIWKGGVPKTSFTEKERYLNRVERKIKKEKKQGVLYSMLRSGPDLPAYPEIRGISEVIHLKRREKRKSRQRD